LYRKLICKVLRKLETSHCLKVEENKMLNRTFTKIIMYLEKIPCDKRLEKYIGAINE